VVSKEFWRILDCDDAMEWVLLGYTGAASTAGDGVRSKDGSCAALRRTVAVRLCCVALRRTVAVRLCTHPHI